MQFWKYWLKQEGKSKKLKGYKQDNNMSNYLQVIYHTYKNPKIPSEKSVETSNHFSKVAGNKINLLKSVVFLHINKKRWEREHAYSPTYNIIQDNKCLGINLTKERKASIKKETEKDTRKQKDMLYSQTGRIDIIKMTILPKAIYRFNVIPIRILTALFTQKEKKIAKSGLEFDQGNSTLEESDCKCFWVTSHRLGKDEKDRLCSS